MSVPESIQLTAAILGIAGGGSGLVTSLWTLREKWRMEADTLRNDLNRAWTNEGAIDSVDTRYLTLEIQLHDRDLIGSLQVNSQDSLLDANVNGGLRSATVTVSRLSNRTSEVVMVAKARLKGNRNRLHWKAVDDRSQGLIPNEMVLWPVMSSISRPVIK